MDGGARVVHTISVQKKSGFNDLNTPFAPRRLTRRGNTRHSNPGRLTRTAEEGMGGQAGSRRAETYSSFVRFGASSLALCDLRTTHQKIDKAVQNLSQ